VTGPSARAAIAGVGISDVGRVYGRSAPLFAAEAVRRAVEDAGLTLADIDGVLMSTGMAQDNSLVTASLGLRNLRLSAKISAAGASAGAAVQYAAMAVQSGMASAVIYVHSDCPLRAPGLSASVAYGSAARERAASGIAAMDLATGLAGATAGYALATRRHMKKFGTTSEQLGAIAVAQRSWAAMNPLAEKRDPITVADHQDSRWIVEPLHLLDCCLVSNGAVAVVITTSERAQYLPQPPAYIWGWGQCHPGYTNRTGSEFGLRSGAAISGEIAFKMAGITKDDIGVREFYDCYTFTVLLTLEDYGFVEKGAGGRFAATGALAPGGSMPTNTGGGQLSSFYLWGATPLHEAVIQTRGQGGARQVANHDFVLCSGNGGILDHHATLILGANPRN
jgi:acetyl-CoA acetyltransferase